MTNKEILKKAIDKAIKNDWIYDDYVDGGDYRNIIFQHSFAKAFWGEEKKRIWKCSNKECNYYKEYFSHNDTQYCPNCGKKLIDKEIPLNIFDQQWAKNLQEMVLEEDPVKYLEGFL